MHSVKLQQTIRLALDTAGMRGVVRRRDVAEQVYRMVRDDDESWSMADKRDALIAYLTSGVTAAMNEAMTEEYLRTNLPNVPKKYLYLLEKLPTYICISTAGLHVLAIKATKEDWAANARIKRAIGEAVIVHADRSSDIHLALASEGADSLEELGMKQAA